MPYDPELIRTLGERHGVYGQPELLPKGGMVNEAWRIGEAILRIVAEGMDAECDEEALREAAVVPLVVQAGIRTPALIAADSSCIAAPRPYTLYQYVEARLLGVCPEPCGTFSEAFRQLGRELAALHRLDFPEHLKGLLREDRTADAHRAVADALLEGAVADQEAREIEALMLRLEPAMASTPPPVLVHNDVHPWNVMVDADGGLAALIDWGDAALGDPAVDLSGMPVEALPDLLQGYSDGGGPVDDRLVARTLYRGISVMLWELREAASLEGMGQRHWWRTPPGGVRELERLIDQEFPGLLASTS